MRQRSAGEKVTGAISWTLVPRATQLCVSVVTSIFIVRTLGQYNYGTLSVLRTILAVGVVFLGFGLGHAINRFVPELRVTGPREGGRRLLLRSLRLQFALWAGVCALLLLLRPLLLERFPTYADLLILGSLLSILEVTAGTLNQYALATYRAREMALANSFSALVLAGALAGLLRSGLLVEGVLLASAISNLAIVTLLSLSLRRSFRDAATPPASPAPSLTDPAALAPAGDLSAAPMPPERGAGSGMFPWKRLLAYALPWIPNNILLYVIWRQSETLLLGIYRTREEAGLFDLAYKLPQMVLEFVPGAVYPLVLAGFAETATRAKERMPEVIATFYRLLFFVVAPLSVMGMAMGDLLLRTMYGADMAGAGIYCQAFFLIFALSFFGTPLSMTVYIVEKVWINLVLNIAYGVVTIGLDLILIPRYGLLGATIPTGIVTALTPIVRYLVARRYMSGITIPWRFIGRCYLASLPLALLFWAKQWCHSPWQTALLLLAAAVATLLSYRLFHVLGREERNFLSRSRLPARHLILRLL